MKIYKILLLITLGFCLGNCESTNNDKSDLNNTSETKHLKTRDLLSDIDPIINDENIRAVIEIPAGTLEKWEFNKITRQIQRDSIENQPRTINYISYLGNYGFIPRTLLSKDKGGDGDPLDILVLGPSAKRGEVLECKIIGVLHLLDQGENDNKLIAISKNASLYYINNITELQLKHKGITEIIELWFANYKGSNQATTNGFSNREEALKILTDAIEQYKINEKKNR